MKKITSFATIGILLLATIILTTNCKKKEDEPKLAVSVSIVASANPVNAGTSVTFTATPVNGGSSPSYQWYKGKTPVGGNSPTYVYVPSNGDSISVVLISSETNQTGSPAPSNTLVMIVNQVIPAFIVTYTTVQLQGGGEGLQFFGKCTNDDVKMTKVTIYDPPSLYSFIYNFNGTSFVKNEEFGLQDANLAYGKEPGTWTFIFVGVRTADGVSFSSNYALTVSK